MSDQVKLFQQEGQGVYDYSEIYDPDVDGSSSSGKIVPAVRSIVFDNRTTANTPYLVKAVDPTTYKVTYQDFPYKVIDLQSSVFNYGNDVLMLYYDNRTSPKRLTVDAKLVIFGTSITSYRLVKGSDVISYTLQQGSGGTSYAASQVPVSEVTDQYVDGVRKCDSCYTTISIADGDLITLELFDSTGVQVSSIVLVAKAATILNSLSAAMNPITGFTATANQVDGEDWFLYKGQSKENLSIYPALTFADGTSFVVPADNNACYIYGMEDVDTDQVGQRSTILVKYFINNRYQVDPSLEVTAGEKRVLTSQHTIKIVDKPVGAISKVSILPVYDSNLAAYNLRFFAYNQNRNGVTDVTNRIVQANASTGLCEFVSGVLVSGSFNPKTYGATQTFNVRFLASSIGDYSSYWEQTFKIILKNPATVPTSGTGRDYWNIIDPDNTNIVYGVDTVDSSRPTIKWDATAVKHFIDTDEFATYEDFVDAFYTLASPPRLVSAGESQAPYPTHFRIRDLTGNALTSAIAVASYHQGFLINASNTETPVSSGTLVVEFLYRVGGSELAILYGAPAIIQAANGEYVADAND